MNNDWLDIDVLEEYLDGKLDAKAMHFVERQALEDPFVAEALEGLKQSPKRKQTLSILQKQLYDRISEKPAKRKMWGITTHRLSIAATATVAFIAVSILFFMRETSRKNAETAARKENGVIVNLDTTTLATTKAAKNDSNTANTRSALIDKAIVDAKTGDLAKNTKKTRVSANDEPALIAEQKKAVMGLAREKTEVAPAVSKAKQAYATSEVAIATAPKLGANHVVFSGNVIDQSNGKPIEGAVVKLTGSNRVTATDAKGYFALPADSIPKDKDLIINAIGFRERPITNVNDPNAIRNAMTGDKSINEIAAIMGSNGRKKENIPAPKIMLKAEQNLDGKTLTEITKPVPVSIINYNQYLETNNRLYNAKGPEQFVIVSFKVKKNGRPTNVKVIKSLTPKADTEAKRLIQTGPDWVLPKNGSDMVEMSIRF
ncbi:carboxypeptidase-like regulatory domain-containing protein [Pedobacter sp. MC2016-05]|uniref:carboxypeptidase-like regulatory domain-containing protein n=1 Tax=Pedobacter sp. MC2016-05 TaxID=2994474 RepID=UPI00224843BA|nr:carboxypeptidase-like regulatory domain-containing protein [Pedobacter sp. MC2016-05]MCX2472992.1 carboxypeptidase-like regulatory domain-containing protein [Pedobacter sp. MC2016-05]